MIKVKKADKESKSSGSGTYSKEMLKGLKKWTESEWKEEADSFAQKTWTFALDANKIPKPSRHIFMMQIQSKRSQEVSSLHARLALALKSYNGSEETWDPVGIVMLDTALLVKAVAPTLLSGKPLTSSAAAASSHSSSSAGEQEEWRKKLATAAASYATSNAGQQEVLSGLKSGSIGVRKIPDSSVPWVTTTRGDHVYYNSSTGQITNIEPRGQASMSKSVTPRRL